MHKMIAWIMVMMLLMGGMSPLASVYAADSSDSATETEDNEASKVSEDALGADDNGASGDSGAGDAGQNVEAAAQDDEGGAEEGTSEEDGVEATDETGASASAKGLKIEAEDFVVHLIYEYDEDEIEQDIKPETEGKLTFTELSDAYEEIDEKIRPQSLDAYERKVLYMRDTDRDYMKVPDDGISVENEETIYVAYLYDPYDYDVLIDLNGCTYPTVDSPLIWSLYDREVTIGGKKYYQGAYDIRSHALINGIKSYYDDESGEYETWPAALVKPRAPKGYIFTGWKVDYYDGGFAKDANGNITSIPGSPSSPAGYASDRATMLGNGYPEMLGREYVASRSQKPVYGHCVVTAQYTNEGFVVAVPKGDEILGNDFQVPTSYPSSDRKGFTIGFLSGTGNTILELEDEDDIRNFTKKDGASYDMNNYHYYAMTENGIFQFVLYTCQGYYIGSDAMLLNGNVMQPSDASFGNAGGKMYTFNNNTNLEVRKRENQKLVDAGKDGVIMLGIKESAISRVGTNVIPFAYSDDDLKMYTGLNTPAKKQYKITLYRNGKRVAISKLSGNSYEAIRDTYYWGEEISFKIDDVETGTSANDKIKVYYRNEIFKQDPVGDYVSYDRCYWYDTDGGSYVEIKPGANGRYSFRAKPGVRKNSTSAEWTRFYIIDTDKEIKDDPKDPDPKDPDPKDPDDPDDPDKPNKPDKPDDPGNGGNGNGDGTGTGEGTGDGTGSGSGSGDGDGTGSGQGDGSGTGGIANGGTGSDGTDPGEGTGGIVDPDMIMPVLDPSILDVSPIVSPTMVKKNSKDVQRVAEEKSDVDKRKAVATRESNERRSSSQQLNDGRYTRKEGGGGGGSPGKKLKKAIKKAIQAYEIVEEEVKKDPNFIPMLLMIIAGFIILGMAYERLTTDHEVELMRKMA